MRRNGMSRLKKPSCILRCYKEIDCTQNSLKPWPCIIFNLNIQMLIHIYHKNNQYKLNISIKGLKVHNIYQ